MSGKEPVHPRELSFEEGVFLVKLARKAVEEFLKKGIKIKPPENIPSRLLRPGMTFTTIEVFHDYHRRSLRGCIGYLQPITSLVQSVIDTAIQAAVEDPRFPPMELDELSLVTFEVSVLSVPKLLRVENRWDLPRHVVVGKHGLVVERRIYKGTLLPQVPVEYGWDSETFLAETCIKAGLSPDCWLDDKTRIYVYEARLWREKEPLGEVEERDMVKELEELWGIKQHSR